MCDWPNHIFALKEFHDFTRISELATCEDKAWHLNQLHQSSKLKLGLRAKYALSVVPVRHLHASRNSGTVNAAANMHWTEQWQPTALFSVTLSLWLFLCAFLRKRNFLGITVTCSFVISCFLNVFLYKKGPCGGLWWCMQQFNYTSCPRI